jgi:RNA polymerase sigma factor (sigma-70 family)
MSDNTPTDRIPDQKVFESLYRQKRDHLVDNIAGLVRDRDRAEDIAASTFQRAWEKRAQFRGDSSLATWVYAIGHNAARQSSQRQKEALRDPLDLESPGYAETDRLAARLEQDELRAQVGKALDRIPAKCRRLLVDRYIDGRSVQEIARRDGVPVGTVGSRLFTAKRLLRAAYSGTTPLGTDMREDKVREIAQDALKRLAEELQAGRSDALKAYLATMGRFHRYSWSNAMLIHSQRPTATRVAGYHTWQELGRSVKRGEKGIMIIAPLVSRRAEPEFPTISRETAQDVFRLTGFRTAYVFDVEQTQGSPLPAFATTTGDPQDYGEKLKAIVANRGITLEYDPTIAPALGVSSNGRIRLVPGLSPAEEFSVLAHELAHEMLHHRGDRPSLSKVIRETQAEAIAYVVSRGVGLETRTAAADYITLYNGDAKTLAESLATIQETSSQILGELMPEERSAQAATRTARGPSITKPNEESPKRNAIDSTPDRPQVTPDPSDSLSLDH